MARVIGVDPGAVRVGLALSDELGITARPLTTLPRRSDRATAEAVRDLAAAHEAARIVVGIPRALDGSEQATTRDARRLAEVIGEVTALPVIGWDERFTTAQAERALIEGGVRREKRREVVDQVAAAIMLQSYLDAEAARAAVSGSGGREPPQR